METSTNSPENQREFFRQNMAKAFQHGRAHFSWEIGSDDSEEDDKLLFNAWFEKYF